MGPAIFSVTPASPGYPARLLTLGKPPATVWGKGTFPGAGKALAIVGSRAATGAGCAASRMVAATLGQRGWTIVSGGALGIDAAAHEGALEVGAPTCAVLGCGVDVVYPDRHHDLFDRIARTGALLSEYPPGTPPRRGNFPKRNRLIVALADAVLVVEAAPRSGALVTARLARLQGRRVLAMPGSVGTDGLIAGGHAVCVRSVDDIEAVCAGQTIANDVVPASGPWALLVAALSERPDTAEGLATRLSWPLPTVMSALTEAELDGWVRRGPGTQYEANRGH